jgi:hypothetical protein
MAGEALCGHIEEMRVAGLTVPDPSTLGAIMAHPDYADSLALLPIEAPVTAAA